MTAPADLPYSETTTLDYATAAASTFTIDDHGVGLQVLRGPCPRCEALIDILIVKLVVKGASPVPDSVEPVTCTCEETHDGRPEDRIGCGAYWNFAL